MTLPCTPLKLGSLELPTNIIQGPLAGISCPIFRKLIWDWGGMAFCCTEMLSSASLAHAHPQKARYVERDPAEQVLCFQLAGNDEQIISQAMERIENSYQADIYDLNCGCPMRKIRKKALGSQLLANAKKLQSIVRTMKQAAGDKPVSIKIRVDGDSGEDLDKSVIDAAVAGGADFITIHGRHWQERYDTPCRLDAIAGLVEYCPLPVIANGDIADTDSLRLSFKHTQCAGAMVSRAGIGQPWLFAQMNAEIRGDTFNAPNLEERGRIYYQHIRGLATMESEHSAVLQARQLGPYYVSGTAHCDSFITALNKVTRMLDLKQLITQHFQSHLHAS